MLYSSWLHQVPITLLCNTTFFLTYHSFHFGPYIVLVISISWYCRRYLSCTVYSCHTRFEFVWNVSRTRSKAFRSDNLSDASGLGKPCHLLSDPLSTRGVCLLFWCGSSRFPTVVSVVCYLHYPFVIILFLSKYPPTVQIVFLFHAIAFLPIALVGHGVTGETFE